MPEDSKIRLSVVSDDFGMCAPVNEGVIQGFERGLLTDANLMAPCPAFPEAAQWAARKGLEVGIHVTFTAEWDYLRWKPLTPLASMVQADGTFHTTVERAWERADFREAEEEFEAQWKAIRSKGLRITYVCEHMGADSKGKMAQLVLRKNLLKNTPYVNCFLDLDRYKIPHYRFDSSFQTSGYSTDLRTTREKLREWLHSLKPGHHLWTVHCAVDHPSLEKICAPSHMSFHWAKTYRMIDQALVLDQEVKGWMESRGIERVPISQCPVKGAIPSV